MQNTLKMYVSQIKIKQDNNNPGLFWIVLEELIHIKRCRQSKNQIDYCRTCTSHNRGEWNK